MAARPPGSVADAVTDVVAAFDKAVNLVRRIEDRKDAKADPESIRDLYKSLALGPIIVQGYYDADSKRLGRAYTAGDFTAQMQLRDVLLHLTTLVSDLKDVLLDEKEIDFRLLQDASDHCRVNAGVCLGQLSQRMANPQPMYMQSPPAYRSGVPSMQTPTQSPSLHYSQSQSHHSFNGLAMPATPDHYGPPPSQDFHPQWDHRAPVPTPAHQYYPQHQRQDTESSMQESFANWQVAGQYGDQNIDRRSERRPSSNALPAEDGALLSPATSQQQTQLLPGQQDLVRNSYTSFNGDPSLSRNSTQSSHAGRNRLGPDHVGDLQHRSSTRSSQISRDRFGPDDFGDVGHTGAMSSDRGSARSATSYASRVNDAGQEYLTLAHEQVSQPAPLRFGNRTPSAHHRHVSSGGAGAPPQEPVPDQAFQQPYHQPFQQHDQIFGQGSFEPQRMPQPMQTNHEGGPHPQRSQSLATPHLIPAPAPAPFQLSPSLQQVLTNNQARQYSTSNTPPYNPQVHPPAPNMPPPIPPAIHHPSLDLGHTPPVVQLQPVQSLRLVQTQFTQSPTIATPTALTPSTSAPQLDRADSVISLPRTMSVSQPRDGALSLPTEKNTQAFCKGAFRLFMGTKKAIIPANRPMGMTISMPYWRCDKCLFEGPMHSLPGPPDKKGRPGKPEKVFDPTPRECGADGRGEGAGGIRFKWVFLAKCHVPMKSPPDLKNGTAGGFCCIFCVAEGASRGWLAPAQTFKDTASISSGNYGGGPGSISGGNGTLRVFGNFSSFMDHLQVHRWEDMWPCEEMRERTKCVVGRIARRDEEWEVNFLPVEGEGGT